jgi:serine/threonine-protein kinase
LAANVRHPVIHGFLGYAYAVAGQTDKARQVLTRMQSATPRALQSLSVSLAIVHMGLGETDRALELLEEAFEERSSYLYFVPIYPPFARLRSHAHCRDLMRRIGLPEPSAPPAKNAPRYELVR